MLFRRKNHGTMKIVTKKKKNTNLCNKIKAK